MAGDVFMETLAKLDDGVDKWRVKLAALPAVNWDSVRSYDDCLAANALLVDVLFGLAFLPHIFNAALRETSVATPEREAVAARVSRKLSLDGTEIISAVGDYRVALDKAMLRYSPDPEPSGPSGPSSSRSEPS